MQQIYIKYKIEFDESQNCESILLWGDLVKIEPFYAKDGTLSLINIYTLDDHLVGSINCWKGVIKERRYYYENDGTIVYIDKEV